MDAFRQRYIHVNRRKSDNFLILIHGEANYACLGRSLFEKAMSYGFQPHKMSDYHGGPVPDYDESDESEPDEPEPAKSPAKSPAKPVSPVKPAMPVSPVLEESKSPTMKMLAAKDIQGFIVAGQLRNMERYPQIDKSSPLFDSVYHIFNWFPLIERPVLPEGTSEDLHCTMLTLERIGEPTLYTVSSQQVILDNKTTILREIVGHFGEGTTMQSATCEIRQKQRPAISFEPDPTSIERTADSNFENAILISMNYTFSKRYEDADSDIERASLMASHKEQCILYINQYFTLVQNLSGDCVVFQELHTPTRDPRGQMVKTVQWAQRKKKEILSTFENCTLIWPIITDTKTKMKPVNPFSWWFQSPMINTRQTVDFDPSEAESNHHLNLFRKLAISKEDVKDVVVDMSKIQTFLDHIRLCWGAGEDETVGEYLLDFFARLMQSPALRTGIAIVLYGGQGCGKGQIMTLLGSIFHGNYMHSANIDDVCGRFASPASAQNLLTFLDECTFAGNRSVASALKALITEKTKRFEVKHVSTVQISNYTTLVFAANHHQVVNVEADNRRYLQLHVQCDLPSGHDYWNRLADTDVHHLAKFLYDRDISGFKPLPLPHTNYERTQKQVCFTTAQLWWLSVLESGFFVVPMLETVHLLSEPRYINRGWIELSYNNWYENRKHGPGDQKSPHILTEYCEFTKVKQKTGIRLSRAQGRERAIEVPSLKEARAQWRALVKDQDWTFNDEEEVMPNKRQKI